MHGWLSRPDTLASCLNSLRSEGAGKPVALEEVMKPPVTSLPVMTSHRVVADFSRRVLKESTAGLLVN